MTDLTMNEVIGVAGLVTVIPVFEHAEVRLEKVEASSELDARVIWRRVLMAEMKQSPHVAEGSRSSVSRCFRHCALFTY
jgi:predicted CoA-binding protein